MGQIDSNWEVSVQDVQAMQRRGEDFLLLDVRQPEEYAICRIQAAQLIPLGELVARIEDVGTLAAGRPIVTLCHHGVRSLNAVAVLREAGLGEARSMAGGIDAWSLCIDSSVERY